VSRTNHRQLTSSIGIAALLREMYPNSFTTTSDVFEASYPSGCVRCGLPIEPGQVAVSAAWNRPDLPAGPMSCTIHYDCPAPSELLTYFFAIDGDVVLRDLPDAREGRCDECGLAMRGTRAVQSWLPSGLLRTTHHWCRLRSGPVPPTPEPTHREMT
jgi:hypothetical protein